MAAGTPVDRRSGDDGSPTRASRPPVRYRPDRSGYSEELGLAIRRSGHQSDTPITAGAVAVDPLAFPAQRGQPAGLLGRAAKQDGDRVRRNSGQEQGRRL